MTHSAAWRSCATSDESNNRLGFTSSFVVPFQILSSFLLHRTTNFPNDHNTWKGDEKIFSPISERKTQTFCIGVIEENLDYVDMLCAWEGVSSNSDTQRLPKSNVGGLRNGLIC
jgi:hypothetical protein